MTYADRLQIYRDVVDAAGAGPVKGRKTPYTALNGNMFSFLSPEGDLCLRFDEDTRAALAARYSLGPVMQYGAVMKGYVAVPLAELAAGDTLEALFAQSLAYARGLPAKPTRR